MACCRPTSEITKKGIQMNLTFTVKNEVVYGITSDGYYITLDVRLRAENLEGRYAQNGISVPSSGRWVVFPGGVITEAEAKEIGKLVTVLPMLFLGSRADRPIIQVR